jgi:putative methionine-R-sulfoxide reductase with GAF domain
VITTAEYRLVPKETHKPVPDEQTLAKLLEAAYILQEHNREMKRLELRVRPNSDPMESESDGAPTQNTLPQEKSVERGFPADLTSTLEKIAETQRQIQIRRMELESALQLVAERLSEMTKAAGAAIAIIEARSVRYRAVAGSGAPILHSIVSLEKAVCAPCLKTGQVLRSRDVASEHVLDRGECKRRGIASLIAVPVYHDGGIAGGLELYYHSRNAFSESDVHTCQLMAGLVAEAFVRKEEATWRKSLASERSAMLHALEKLQPNLAALVERPAAQSASSAEVPETAATSNSCPKCGHQLVAEEQFCGQCGTARATDYEVPNVQSKVASLWQMQQLQKKLAESEGDRNGLEKVAEKPVDLSPELSIARSLERQIPDLFTSEDLEVAAGNEIVEMPTSLKLQEIPHIIEGEVAAGEVSETDGPPDESLDQAEALTTSESSHGTDWSSATSARASLERFASGKRSRTVLQFWNRHRGDIYLAIAVILVLCVIRWAIWSGPRAKTTGTPTTASATHHKPAHDPGLSFFDRVLIQFGLAEAPDPLPDKGSPQVQVWVDLHTALYYCPGADLYGKTPKGKFTTQREAQLDHFEPAYRKACD